MKISADLIDLDLSPLPDDDPPITLLYKPKPKVIQLESSKSSWAQLNSQILQSLNQNPYSTSIGIYYKKQNKKLFINSDKTLQEAIEYARSQGKELRLTAIPLEDGPEQEEEEEVRGARAASVKFVPEPGTSSQQMSDEEELAWVKQHGWMRALIKNVEAKAHAVTVAHLANLLHHLSPAEAKQATCSVVCNLCNNLVLGPFYKCSVCEDFDLCPGCENTSQAHDDSHPLLKFKAARMEAKKLAHHHSGVKRKREKNAVKVAKHSGFLNYNASCKEFRHIYSVEPGQSFTEVWTIENTGLKTWDRHVSLKCIGNSGTAVVPQLEKLSVAPRMPCEVARIPVVFNILPGVPQGPNPCISMWRLCRKDIQFGPTLVTSFTVAQPRTLEQKETIAQVLTAAVSDDQPSVKRKAFISSTNTPNNTPFVLSPPKSPEPPPQPEVKDEIKQADEEEGRLSSNSSESEDSEFVVIPCPPLPSATDSPTGTGENYCQDLESISDSMAVLSMDGTVSSLADTETPAEEQERRRSSPELEQEEAFRCLVTKVNLLCQNSDTTAVKTLTPYPCLSELAVANLSLSRTLFENPALADEFPQPTEETVKVYVAPTTQISLTASPSPASQISSPVVQASPTTVQQAFTPAVHQISTPVAQAPTVLASTPVAQVSVPAAQASTPVAQASIPVAQASTPVAPASTPVAQASTPVAQVSVPAAQASTPVAQASTPVAQASTPVAQVSTPTTQASTPTTQATAAQTPAAEDDSAAQQPPQASGGNPQPTFPPYPCDGIPPVMNVVNGMAKVYNTAKAVLQHLTPPVPRTTPPPTATSEQGEFVYPQEAWIGNHMTTQEYQYFEWKFGPMIQSFHEMGFKDRIRIEYLLQKFNGDVNKVANTLLCDPAEDPDNNWFLTRHRAFDFD